jgi:hypothetical protein
MLQPLPSLLFLRYLTPTLHPGDVADDRFFHKSNDSDATQFSLLYPRIGAHGKPSLNTCHPLFSLTLLSPEYIVWATFWIIFELGILVAFSVIGITAFKVPKPFGLDASQLFSFRLF